MGAAAAALSVHGRVTCTSRNPRAQARRSTERWPRTDGARCRGSCEHPGLLEASIERGWSWHFVAAATEKRGARRLRGNRCVCHTERRRSRHEFVAQCRMKEISGTRVRVWRRKRHEGHGHDARVPNLHFAGQAGACLPWARRDTPDVGWRGRPPTDDGCGGAVRNAPIHPSAGITAPRNPSPAAITGECPSAVVERDPAPREIAYPDVLVGGSLSAARYRCELPMRPAPMRSVRNERLRPELVIRRDPNEPEPRVLQPRSVRREDVEKETHRIGVGVVEFGWRTTYRWARGDPDNLLVP